MLRVGFEPKIPVFEPAKTVHALDRTATVIDTYCIIFLFNLLLRAGLGKKLRQM
jgi:hypothetical protein